VAQSTSVVATVEQLAGTADADLFNTITANPNHYLYQILSQSRPTEYSLRKHGHHFLRPTVNVSSKLRATSMEDQTLEAMWGHYKSALDFAAREVLGKRLCAKKPWISQATLAVIEQRRQAIRRGDVGNTDAWQGQGEDHCGMLSSNGWSR